MALTADDYTYRLPDHWIAHEHGEDKDGTFAHLHSYYVARAIEIIKSSGARTVLEVGCGDGWNCGQMAIAGLDTVGIDWSVNAINYAKALVRDARFLRGDVRDPAFLNSFPDKFDAVALIEVLEHIPPNDCIDAVRNITKPLKPGGTFVLTTPSVNLTNDNPQHYRHFTEPLLREIIAAAGGLTVVSVEGYGDVQAERRHYQLSRWIENRYYRIKPLLRILRQRFKDSLRPTPFDRCHGFIVTSKRT